MNRSSEVESKNQCGLSQCGQSPTNADSPAANVGTTVVLRTLTVIASFRWCAGRVITAKSFELIREQPPDFTTGGGPGYLAHSPTRASRSTASFSFSFYSRVHTSSSESTTASTTSPPNLASTSLKTSPRSFSIACSRTFSPGLNDMLFSSIFFSGMSEMLSR